MNKFNKLALLGGVLLGLLLILLFAGIISSIVNIQKNDISKIAESSKPVPDTVFTERAPIIKVIHDTIEVPRSCTRKHCEDVIKTISPKIQPVDTIKNNKDTNGN